MTATDWAVLVGAVLIIAFIARRWSLKDRRKRDGECDGYGPRNLDYWNRR